MVLFSHNAHFIVKSHALFSLQEMVDDWRMCAPPAEEQYPDEPTDLPPECLEEPEENWRSLLSPQQHSAIGLEEHDQALIPFLRWFNEDLLCFDTDPTTIPMA